MFIHTRLYPYIKNNLLFCLSTEIPVSYPLALKELIFESSRYFRVTHIVKVPPAPEIAESIYPLQETRNFPPSPKRGENSRLLASRSEGQLLIPTGIYLPVETAPHFLGLSHKKTQGKKSGD